MSEKQCGTCRYWGDGEVLWPDSEDGFAQCGGIGQDGVRAIAYTWDDEGYSSGLRTKAEFGCKLWEAEDE